MDSLTGRCVACADSAYHGHIRTRSQAARRGTPGQAAGGRRGAGLCRADMWLAQTSAAVQTPSHNNCRALILDSLTHATTVACPASWESRR